MSSLFPRPSPVQKDPGAAAAPSHPPGPSIKLLVLLVRQIHRQIRNIVPLNNARAILLARPLAHLAPQVVPPAVVHGAHAAADGGGQRGVADGLARHVQPLDAREALQQVRERRVYRHGIGAEFERQALDAEEAQGRAAQPGGVRAREHHAQLTQRAGGQAGAHPALEVARPGRGGGGVAGARAPARHAVAEGELAQVLGGGVGVWVREEGAGEEGEDVVAVHEVELLDVGGQGEGRVRDALPADFLAYEEPL